MSTYDLYGRKRRFLKLFRIAISVLAIVLAVAFALPAFFSRTERSINAADSNIVFNKACYTVSGCDQNSGVCSKILTDGVVAYDYAWNDGSRVCHCLATGHLYITFNLGKKYNISKIILRGLPHTNGNDGMRRMSAVGITDITNSKMLHNTTTPYKTNIHYFGASGRSEMFDYVYDNLSTTSSSLQIDIYTEYGGVFISEIEIYGSEYDDPEVTPPNQTPAVEHTEDISQTINSMASSNYDLNHQFAIPNGDGTYKNMTDLNEMTKGQRMYVLVVSCFDENIARKFLTYNGLQQEITCTTLSATTGNNSKSFLQFIWVLEKVDTDKFMFRAYNNMSHCLIYSNTSIADNTVVQTHNSSDQKSWWTLVQQDHNIYTIKPYLSGRNGKAFLNRNTDTNSTVGKKPEDVIIWNRPNSSDSYPKDKWLIYPILQNISNDVTYGFSGRPTYAKETGVPNKPVYSTISNLSTTDQYGYNITCPTVGADGGIYDNIIQPPEYILGQDGSISTTAQLFKMRCFSQSTKAMQWEIFTEKYQGTTTNNVVSSLDVSGFEAIDGRSVGFYGQQNNAADQQFWIVYSLQQDGGYYIVPVSFSNDSNYEFRVLTLNEGKDIVTTNKMASKPFQRWWINSESGTESYTIKDVVVEVNANNEIIVPDGGFESAMTLSSEIKELFYNSTYYDASELNAHVGYTYLTGKDSAKQATLLNKTLYRFYKRNKYNLSFTSSLGSGHSSTKNSVYCDEQIGNELSSISFTASFVTNGKTANSSQSFKWTFDGWANGDGKYASTKTIVDILKDIGEVGNGNTISLEAAWKGQDPISFPAVSREKHVLYGWTNSSSSADNLLDNLSGITANTTYYAYWIGADLTGMSEKLGSLSAAAGIYGSGTTKLKSYTDKITYKWTVVDKDSESQPISGNSFNFSGYYGKAVKCSVYHDGTLLNYGYSKLSPTNILVDATPSAQYNDAFITSGQLNNGVTATYNITVSSGIASAVYTTLSGISYKVYGVWGNDRVLVSNSENLLGGITENNKIEVSKEGIVFDKYQVEITNNSGTVIDFDGKNFALRTLPKIYKLNVTGNNWTASLNDDAKTANRATYQGESYFYNTDKILLNINIGTDKKLTAGSHIVIDGVKVFPTQSNSQSGIITFTYTNEYEALRDKLQNKNNIAFSEKDKNVVIDIQTVDNLSSDNQIDYRINIGPLGAKRYTKGNVAHIRFTSVWYLDDVITQSRWHRGDGFGALLIPYNNLLKETANNDFYTYLQTEIFKNDANGLKDLVDNWRTKDKNSNMDLIESFLVKYCKDANTEKLSFGGAEIDVVAENYYLVNKDGKKYIEFSVCLPVENHLEDEVVFIPYSSYVAEHTNGFFVPKRENLGTDKNVYSYSAPSVYSYDGINENY